MTGTELVEAAQRIIQDTSYEDDIILKYLNNGLFDTASHGQNSLSEIKFNLPGLETIATVDTSVSADNVPLPDNYFRDVSGVFSITNSCWITDPARRPYNFSNFKRWCPLPGSGLQVEDVVVRNNTLFYAPIPVEPETLQLLFIEKPTKFTFSTSPDVIPEHLQELILCSYAAWRIFKQIEDRIEGPQANMDRQWADYTAGLTSLRDQIGAPDTTPFS